jgi:hypothetical protein
MRDIQHHITPRLANDPKNFILSLRVIKPIVLRSYKLQLGMMANEGEKLKVECRRERQKKESLEKF